MVERKKKSMLPWILIALLILGIIGYLIWRTNYAGQTTTTTTTQQEQTTTAPSGTTTQYMEILIGEPTAAV